MTLFEYRERLELECVEIETVEEILESLDNGFEKFSLESVTFENNIPKEAVAIVEGETFIDYPENMTEQEAIEEAYERLAGLTIPNFFDYEGIRVRKVEHC